MPRGLRLVKPLVWPAETATATAAAAAAAAAPEEDEGGEEVEEEAEERKDEGAGDDGANCREEEGWAGNGASGTMATPQSEPRSSPPPSNDVRDDDGGGGGYGSGDDGGGRVDGIDNVGYVGRNTCTTEGRRRSVAIGDLAPLGTEKGHARGRSHGRVAPAGPPGEERAVGDERHGVPERVPGPPYGVAVGAPVVAGGGGGGGGGRDDISIDRIDRCSTTQAAWARHPRDDDAARARPGASRPKAALRPRAVGCPARRLRAAPPAREGGDADGTVGIPIGTGGRGACGSSPHILRSALASSSRAADAAADRTPSSSSAAASGAAAAGAAHGPEDGETAAEEEEARRRTSSVGVRRPPAPDDGDCDETRLSVLSRTNGVVVPDPPPPRRRLRRRWRPAPIASMDTKAARAGQHRRASHEGDPRRTFGYQRRRLGAAREDKEDSDRGGDYGPVLTVCRGGAGGGASKDRVLVPT